MTTSSHPFSSILKPYAIDDEKSQGRKTKDPFHPKDYRSHFQHDRDRILHSKAFRRLEAKTQVVLTHENDHTRTRLTHSLEVSQISESIAIKLGLNSFATMAMALGHDVGHTPFGHTGERALSKILQDYGLPPFKHNYQGVLVVNNLEKRFKGDNGLNLMWETRDGILKHSSLTPDMNLKDYDPELTTNDYPITLEGQIVHIVDEIAQRAHDTDDGLRTNRIKITKLLKKPIIKNVLRQNKFKKNDILTGFSKEKNKVISLLVTALMKFYVLHTMDNSAKNIKEQKIKTYDDILACNGERLIIGWDEKFREKDKKFQREFLHPHFYEHHDIKRMDSRAEYFISQLFKAFKNHPQQLPQKTCDLFIEDVKNHLESILADSNENPDLKSEIKDFLNKDKLPCKESCDYIPASKFPSDEQRKASNCILCKEKRAACKGIRVIANHIAGMTDRYTHLEYSRLYFPPEISRM